MPFPEPNVCPNCGLTQSDRGCVQCIPPEFRAETARMMYVESVARSAAADSFKGGVQEWFAAVAEQSVVAADALIAALRKPPVKE